MLLGELLHDGEHLAHELAVERRGRLVEEHQLGLHRERAGDRHALLLAAREAAGRASANVSMPTIRSDSRASSRASSRLHLAHLDEREHDVLDRRHLREEVEVLEDEADLAVQLPGVAHGRPEDVDLAALDRLQPGDAAQQRGLARAARPDDHDDLAARHVEAHAAQDLDGAVLLRDGADDDALGVGRGVEGGSGAVTAAGWSSMDMRTPSDPRVDEPVAATVPVAAVGDPAATGTMRS